MNLTWTPQAFAWFSLCLVLFALGIYLRIASRRVTLHHRPILIAFVLISTIPAIHVCLVWGNAIADSFFRVQIPAMVLVPPLACAYAAWRLATLSPRVAPLRRTLMEALGMASVLCASVPLSGPFLGRALDQMTVLMLVDRSRSMDLVPNAETRMRSELQIAEKSMRAEDSIGTIAFAAQAATEDPPRPKSEVPVAQRIEIGRDGTDIGAAIRRALAEIPPETSARLVILSDGVSNRGDPMGAAAAAVAAQVPIDVVPFDQKSIPDVRAVALRMPPRANQGETVELRIVTSASSKGDVELRIKRDGQLISKSVASISEGEDVLRARDRVPDPGLHRYDVEISSLDPSLDQAAEDNVASAFVRVRGHASALVIDGDPGKTSFIANSLRQADFIVTEGSVAAIPGDIGGFASYDVVFWSDVPAYDVSPSQLDAILTYVRDLGGGLVILGGDKSMGPGGYSQTPLEEASPLSFDIKHEKRRASLAEAIIIDYSGSMSASAGRHTKLELANEAAARSASLLGEGDRLGVAHVDTVVSWSVPMAPVRNAEAIGRAIRAVKDGGGGIYTDIALQAGYAALSKEAVNLKHLLLFADGNDAEQLGGCRTLVSAAKRKGITTSVVSLGRGNDTPELEVLSKLGDGRFYLIEDANRLPAVFAQETILAAKAAIHELDFRVVVAASGAPIQRIDFSRAPILKGYVVTVPKDRSSVLLSGPEGDPILATWSIGTGRSAAFTSDLKDRWGAAWTSWPGASSLVVQVARDVLRLADDPHVRLEADAVGGDLHVRAEVLGDDGRAQSFRRLTVHVGGPDGFSREMPLEAVGAGAYAATLPLSRPGPYVVVARDELKMGNVAVTGAVLSAGEEMRPTGSDRALLTHLATTTGGRVRDTLAGVFRDRASVRYAYRGISTWLVAFAALSLLFAVASRKLALPRWIAEAPIYIRDAIRKRIHMRHASSPEPSAPPTAISLARDRERARAKAIEEPGVQAAPVDQPVVREHAKSVQRKPARLVSTTRGKPSVRTNESPRTEHAPRASNPGNRPLSAAEILLERRRGRRS